MLFIPETIRIALVPDLGLLAVLRNINVYVKKIKHLYLAILISIMISNEVVN